MSLCFPCRLCLTEYWVVVLIQFLPCSLEVFSFIAYNPWYLLWVSRGHGLWKKVQSYKVSDSVRVFFFQMTSCRTLVERQEERIPGISHPFSAAILNFASLPPLFVFCFSPLSLQNVHYWEHSASFPWLWSLPLIRREELPRPHQPLGDWPFSCSELCDTAGYRASSVFFRVDQHVDFIIASTETVLYI